MHGTIGESSYTKEVTTLIKLIHSNTPVKDSLYEQAIDFFSEADDDNALKIQLKNQVEEAREAANKTTGSAQKSAEIILQNMQLRLKDEINRQKKNQLKRQECILSLCQSILLLSEGCNYEETQTHSAKFLGTLLLLSPHEGKKLPELHEKLKPSYKAVLALRLLDKLISEKMLIDSYIQQFVELHQRYPSEEGELSDFQYHVCIPIIMAILLQDIGLYHPSAQLILKGPDGDLDEYRVLDNAERKELLKISYHQSLNFLVNGIGVSPYKGNSKEDKLQYEKEALARLQFSRAILTDSVKPKTDAGNLLKIAQIYASVIFSTKTETNLNNLPKATLVLEKAALQQTINPQLCQSFISIVGHFPQGFGITYIPKDRENQDLERYEYAIVFALNPPNPFIPICRTATRHLTFNSVGKRISVPIDSNLYFANTRKKFSLISPERLEAILRKLWSNFEQRKQLELIPSCWNPYEYFGYQKFQNLWKRSK